MENTSTNNPNKNKSRWVIDSKRFGDNDVHCEKCGAIVDEDSWLWNNYYFCYHCGANMRESPFDPVGCTFIS